MRGLVVSLLAILIVPAPALGQSGAEMQKLGITGEVPGTCALGVPRLAGTQLNFRGINGNTLPIDQLVDTDTLSTEPASTEIGFEAACDFPHRLRLETQNNGLWRASETTGRVPDGFGDAVPYRVTLQWASESLQIMADARSRRATSGSLFVNATAIGTLLLRLEIDAGATNHRANAPLVAGTYGDTLRITLEPQQ